MLMRPQQRYVKVVVMYTLKRSTTRRMYIMMLTSGKMTRLLMFVTVSKSGDVMFVTRRDCSMTSQRFRNMKLDQQD